jgi:hypothetical protein
MPTKTYATKRAQARAVKFPGETGAKRLAARLGCGWVSVYEWERDGNDHLPKNSRTRAAYLRAIGLSVDLRGVVGGGSARRAHAHKATTRGAL